ncbi:Uncharacterised protein [uncultured Clostridium sp.]|nr:hypothetical protein [Paeniclostridium sordellii]SCJ49268.1 Uncharacterised protein [uncultured Clostridium sp.]SCJ49821.1 Uncharacterised protein [uncultured Clostridium sp.]
MSDRKNEINFIVDMIYKLCVESDICLLPHELDDGTKLVVIQDNRNGKKYAITKNK